MLFSSIIIIIILLIQHELYVTKAQELSNIPGYATEGQFPFMVGVLLKGELKCGGSIISKSFILTAAHCFYRRDPLQMSVVLGSIKINSATGIEYNISRVISHPDYKYQNQDFDIALVLVKQFMPLGTATVNNIQLSNVDKDYPPNTMATVMGYALNIGGDYEIFKLKFGHIPMWSRKECDAAIRPAIQDHMICAADSMGRVSLCAGDSGGPVIIDNKVFGVVSFGYGCGTNHPTVFIRVPSFLSWIKKNTGLDF